MKPSTLWIQLLLLVVVAQLVAVNGIIRKSKHKKIDPVPVPEKDVKRDAEPKPAAKPEKPKEPTTPAKEPTKPAKEPTTAAKKPTPPKAQPTKPQTTAKKAPAATTPAPKKNPDAKDGTDDSLADYVVNKIGDMIKNEDLTTPHVEDCSLPDTLDRYNCSLIPQTVKDFFDGDISVKGLLGKLFKAKVWRKLMDCEDGSWCLNMKEHLRIKKLLPDFYQHSPFCSKAMQCSLDTMLKRRFQCEEKPLVFLANAVTLMCDLRRTEDYYEMPACGDNDECYTRTKEALYVLYLDILRPNPKHQEKMHADNCNKFKIQIAKTYVCADRCCQFAQQEILRRFQLWDGLAESAEDIHDQCNISDECIVNNYLNHTSEQDELAQQILHEELGVIDGLMAEVENMTGELESEARLYPDFGDFAGMDLTVPGPDHTALYAAVVISMLMAMSLVFILFVGFRRIRRSKGYDSFFKRGYSELTEEETRMLKNEYN